MSEERPLQEQDAVPTGRIAFALGGTIVLTVVCLVWVWAVMKPFEGADRRRARASYAIRTVDGSGPPAVDRTVYDPAATFSAPLLEKKREWLSSWGWVDRAKGTIHMPIDKAMKLVVDEAQRP